MVYNNEKYKYSNVDDRVYKCLCSEELSDDIKDFIMYSSYYFEIRDSHREQNIVYYYSKDDYIGSIACDKEFNYLYTNGFKKDIKVNPRDKSLIEQHLNKRIEKHLKIIDSWIKPYSNFLNSNAKLYSFFKEVNPIDGFLIRNYFNKKLDFYISRLRKYNYINDKQLNRIKENTLFVYEFEHEDEQDDFYYKSTMFYNTVGMVLYNYSECSIPRFNLTDRMRIYGKERKLKNSERAKYAMLEVYFREFVNIEFLE